MKTWGVIWWKEVKENLRDWRVILPTLIIGPILSPVLTGVLISTVLNQSIEQSDKVLELPVVGIETAPNLVQFLRTQGVKVEPLSEDRAGALAAVRERSREMVLVVPPDLATDWEAGRTVTLELVFDQSRRSSVLPARRAEALIAGYGQMLGRLRLLARGLDPDVVQPVAVDRIDVSTPSGRSVLLLSFLTYILLFAVLLGGLPVINDGTAGERERKSLEPLLTTPVSRTQVIVEKILAATFFMVAALVIGVTVVSVGLPFLPLERLGMQSRFDLAAAGVTVLVMAPFALFGAGLMSIVASFTKTYKEAQTYLGLVVMIPTVPIMFAGFMDLKPELPLMAVPSLSQHLIFTSLLKAEPVEPLFVAVSMATTGLAAVAFIALAARLYQRESLLG